jgi:hypothetical protein
MPVDAQYHRGKLIDLLSLVDSPPMLHSRLYSFVALFCAVNLLATCLAVGITSGRLANNFLSTGDIPGEREGQIPPNQNSSEENQDSPIQELISLLTRSVDLLFSGHGSHGPVITPPLYARLRCEDLFRPPCA